MKRTHFFKILIRICFAVYFVIGFVACEKNKVTDRSKVSLQTDPASSEKLSFSPASLKKIEDLFRFYSPAEGLTKSEIIRLYQGFIPELAEPLKSFLSDSKPRYQLSEFMEALYTKCPPLKWATLGIINSSEDLQKVLTLAYPQISEELRNELWRLMDQHLKMENPMDPKKLFEIGVSIASITFDETTENQIAKSLLLRHAVMTNWNLQTHSAPGSSNSAVDQAHLDFAKMVVQLQVYSLQSERLTSASVFSKLQLQTPQNQDGFNRKIHRELFTQFTSSTNAVILEEINWAATSQLSLIPRSTLQRIIPSEIPKLFPKSAAAIQSSTLILDTQSSVSFMQDWNLLSAFEILLTHCPSVSVTSLKWSETQLLFLGLLAKNQSQIEKSQICNQFQNVIQSLRSFPRQSTLLDEPLCRAENETLRSSFLNEKTDGSKWSDTLPIRSLNLSLFPHRITRPEFTELSKVTDILYLLTNPSAPVVFVQSGFGSDGKSPYNYFLMGKLHHLGFNVVSVPSHFFWRMNLAISSSLRPGNTTDDAKQLVEAYKMIRSQLEENGHLTAQAKNMFVGISMGAYSGIQIANFKNPNFIFDKFVFINPPMKLNFAFENIDSAAMFLPNVASELSEIQRDELQKWTFRIIAQFSHSQTSTQQIEAFLGTIWTPQQLRALIVSDLIESLQKTAVISQAIENQNVFTGNGLRDFAVQSRRWNFKSYFDSILFPFFQTAGTAIVEEIRNPISANQLFTSMENKNKILLLHSKNDFISEESEIVASKGILGQRAIITNCGGHVGGLANEEFQKPLFDFLTGPTD